MMKVSFPSLCLLFLVFTLLASCLTEQKLAMPLTTVISYWKPEVAINLISDFNTYPVDYGELPPFFNCVAVWLILLSVPQAVAKNAVRSSDNELFYKPSLHVDEIGLTSDKYIHLNSSVQQLPLKISFGPMSSQVSHPQ